MVGLHEEFHDTINLAKRKPRRLAGTPAARFTFWGALIGASLLTYFAVIYKEFEFTRASRERWMMLHLPDEGEHRKHIYLNDPCLRSALLNLEQKQMGALDPTTQSDSATV
ncbi:uncharacterized protein [Chelonus insularis]|uniref:uncharacterized protein n=1 Tax=Chelonus insularis TaxID=460826 RepID=UPI00158E6526|nr:uncharacterized protein LOC118071770 [Chelonus insularis]